MYLVIGANGFLGSYIVRSIIEKTSQKIIATARNIEGLQNSERILWKKLDITKENEFDDLITEVKSVTDLKVVFLAAYHNPDLVAENPQYAWNINVTTLSKCLNKLYFAKKLFYASTDSVYGNSIDGYKFKESDALNPVNIYGKQKCAAEAIVKYLEFNVVRFPFLIGTSLVKGKPHFYDKIKASLSENKTVEMFSDSYRSSLNFKTAADLLVDLCELEKEIPNILNVCGDKSLSKYDIGMMMWKNISETSEGSCLVKPISVNDINGKNVFKSPRAESTLMDNILLKKILNIKTVDFEI